VLAAIDKSSGRATLDTYLRAMRDAQHLVDKRVHSGRADPQYGRLARALETLMRVVRSGKVWT
jgi:hypothetical protein